MTLRATTQTQVSIPAIALPKQRPAFMDILSIPSFRYLWLGNGLSYMSDKVLAMAIAWLVLDITNSNLWVGIVNGVPAITAVLFVILGGVLADRSDRRTLVMRSRLALGGLVFLTAVLIAAGMVTIWQIMLIAVLIVGVIGIDSSISRTLVYDVVGKENLLSGTSLNSMARNFGYIIGPVIAGVLMARVGVDAAMFMLAGAYLIASAVMFRVRIKAEKQEAKPIRVLADMKEGVAYIRQTPRVRWLVAITFSLPLAGVFFGMMPVYAKEVLQVGPQGLGMMMAAFGLGAVVISLIMTLHGEIKNKGLVMVIFGVAFSAGMIVMAFSTNFPLTLASIFLTGIVGVGWMNLSNTLIQTATSSEMRGRVMSIFMIGVQLMTLGWLIAGVMTTLVGNEGALVISGLIFGGFGLFVYAKSKEVRAM